MITDKDLLTKTLETMGELVDLLPDCDILLDVQDLLQNAILITDTLHTRHEILDEIKQDMLQECIDKDNQILTLKSNFKYYR